MIAELADSKELDVISLAPVKMPRRFLPTEDSHSQDGAGGIPFQTPRFLTSTRLRAGALPH